MRRDAALSLSRYCAVPLALSLAAALAQRQATVIGKVPTMVVNR